jgi:hypothetical protein
MDMDLTRSHQVQGKLLAVSRTQKELDRLFTEAENKKSNVDAATRNNMARMKNEVLGASEELRVTAKRFEDAKQKLDPTGTFSRNLNLRNFPSEVAVFVAKLHAVAEEERKEVAEEEKIFADARKEQSEKERESMLASIHYFHPANLDGYHASPHAKKRLSRSSLMLREIENSRQTTRAKSPPQMDSSAGYYSATRSSTLLSRRNSSVMSSRSLDLRGEFPMRAFLVEDSDVLIDERLNNRTSILAKRALSHGANPFYQTLDRESLLSITSGKSADSLMEKLALSDSFDADFGSSFLTENLLIARLATEPTGDVDCPSETGSVRRIALLLSALYRWRKYALGSGV